MNTGVCLQAITNILLVNNQFVKEYGLLTGKMGICLYLYEYARFIQSAEYTTYADDLLDEIINNVKDVNSFDFSTGLPGIAFGIDYLLKHKFVEGDSGEVLGDMENRICQSITDYINEPEKVMPPLIISPVYFIYKGDFSNKKYLLARMLQYVDRILQSDTYMTSTCLNSILFLLKSMKKYISLPASLMKHTEAALEKAKYQLSTQEMDLTQSLYAGMNEDSPSFICNNISGIEFYTWQGLLYGYKIKTDITSNRLKEYVMDISANFDNEDLGLCKLSGIGLGLLKDIYC